MKAKTQMKKTWIVLALITVLSFSSLGAIYASTTPDYMSAAMSLSSLNARIANLDAADVQNLVTIAGKMNNVLFNGINGNPAILDTAEKQCLYNTYSINQSIYPMIMNGGFVYYIDNATSHGNSGYAGFIDAVRTSNLDYLADLLRFTNDAALAETKNQLEFYGLTYVDQLAIYSQLVQVQYEPGLAFTPSVIQQYEAILQDITARSSGGDAQLSLQMLANCGITVENIEAVFNQLSDADRQTLEGILDKMGLIIHEPAGELKAVSFKPDIDEIDVPLTSDDVQVTFNMDISIVNPDGIKITTEGGEELENVTADVSDNVLNIKHPAFQYYDVVYKVTIPAGAVKSATSNATNELIEWSFRTIKPGPEEKLVATSYKPGQGEEDVSLTADVRVTFNMSINVVYPDGIKITTEGGEELENVTAEVLGNVLTIKHPAFQYYDVVYKVTVPAGAVKSATIDATNDLIEWSFRTIKPGPEEKLVATSYKPGKGEEAVSLNADVKATFNMSINVVNPDGIKIATKGGEDLGDVTATVLGNVLNINHPAAFQDDVVYKVTISAGAVKSATTDATNDLIDDWEFTTVSSGTVEGDYVLTVNTDSTSYLFGKFEEVTVTGFVYKNDEVKEYLENITVGLVLRKGNTEVYFGQVTTDVEGKYKWEIPAANLELGDYTILATSNLATGLAAFSVMNEDEPTGKPVIVKYVPGKDDTSVSLSTEVSATFNMDVTAVNLEGVKIEKDGTELSDVTISIDDDGVLRISHPKFNYKTYYTVIIPEGTVRGETGELNDADEWTFKTKSKGSSGGGGSEPVDECTFIDLKTSHWAYEIITGLCKKGIVDGYPNGSFQPEGTITRAELTKLFVEAMSLSITQPDDPTFSDVAPGAWYYKYVETAVEAGLVKGYENGEFHPDARITRQEIAAIVARALDMEEEAAEAALEDTGFTDDDQIAAWAKGYVVIEHREGIVDGYPDKSFAPLNNATRAEACAMLSRYMEKMGE